MGLFRWLRVASRQGRFVQQAFFAKMVSGAASAVSMLLFCVALSHAQTSATTSATPSPAAPAFREITDEIGRPIRIPQSVRRIVSLAPSLTETIYALGLQDRLVGDSDYCDFPPEARQKTKVGGAINPSLEAIAALHPDLVLVTKSLNRLETVNALADLGIPSYATDPRSVDDIISSTQRLAELLGAPEVGAALARDMARRLADTLQRVAPLPRRRVLFVVWTQPLISVGKDTFIADALQHAGAISIVDSSQNWPQLNLEEVVRQQPDFLVFAESHSETAPLNSDALSNLPGWRILDAVRNRRYAVTSDAVNRPAPRIVSAIADLARQFHPEAFAEKPESDKDKANRQTPLPPSVSPLLSSLSRVAGKNFSAAEEYACAR
jgi:iron complex transport system substrate-binding protein